MTQPEALRLADELEKDKWHITAVTAHDAADELRRLYAASQELLEALEKIANVNAMNKEYQAWARAAIAKVEGKT